MIFKKSNNDKSYKFKSLQCYAWDKVLGPHKKFRKVFDKNELNYLSTELAFYNKFFDEQEWKAKIELKAFLVVNNKNDEEICANEEEITVSMTDNIVIYDYGYGAEEHGRFWKSGKYRWVAKINGEEIATCDFYIEDYALVTDNKNPYFEVLTLKTYESPYGDIDEKDRTYYREFSAENTRYIMGELKFRNKIKTEWLCEVFFFFYDDTGQRIGESQNMVYITPQNGAGETFTISAGYGSKNPGSWLKDNYRVEVVFMDTTVAVVPFSIGDKNVICVSDYEALINEDVAGLYNPSHVNPEKLNKKDENTPEEKSEPVKETSSENENTSKTNVEIIIDNRPLSEILGDLNALIGLESIKKKIREYVDYVNFLQQRKEMGFKEDEEISLHAVFTGNPGTGKTTVVKLLGKIFHSMGLLSKGHVHSVEASDLISEFIRQTGKQTKEEIKKAKGGILFVDEAYMLFKEGSTTDFGTEAVAALITEMSDGDGDIAIMMAGYPKEMESLIKSNPGLQSRLKHHFHFDDYTPEELLEIAEHISQKKGVKLSREAAEKLDKIITKAYRKRDKTFGNARFATALVDEAKMNMGIRVVNQHAPEMLNKKLLSLILPVDVEDIEETANAKKLKLPIDNELLKEALSELNNLTGLDNIKQEINELVRLTRYYKEMNRDVLKAFSMHSVFSGNPGTGKTTVAKIIGKIYKALGLLERGHFVNADGSSLVAGFVGQTALKTKDLIAESMGGILFIDEAYSLTEGHNNEFGKQAVAALIKEMEEQRGNFSLIVAGYTDNMNEFMKSNPGLDSRFDKTFEFNDFNEAELWEITRCMLEEKGFTIDAEAENHLKKYIGHLQAHRTKFFGNARSMRKIVEKAIRNQELRMADLPMAKRTTEEISIIRRVDVQEFVITQPQSKPSLGFRING